MCGRSLEEKWDDEDRVIHNNPDNNVKKALSHFEFGQEKNEHLHTADTQLLRLFRHLWWEKEKVEVA